MIQTPGFKQYGARALLSVTFAMLLLAACTSQREPAQKMMSDIETAVGAAAVDAEKYVPGQLTDVQAKLDDLKTAFSAQDYQGVLARGPAILSEARGLETAAAAKKADLSKALGEQWTALANSVPQDESIVQQRIDMLSERRNRRLARGIDVDAARSAFGDAASQWSKAQGAFGNGNLDEAVTAGKNAQAKLESAAGGLKIELPGAIAGAIAPAAPR